MAAARKAHAAGDTAELDRVLKELLPGSKGLSEFTADGSRYAEFRKTAKKTADKLAEKDADLTQREANLQRGLAAMEQTVARYQHIEQMLDRSKTDDDAFVELLEQRTGKKLNEIAKRRLDKALAKPVDPHVAELERQLKAEREARETKERQEQEQRQQQERTQQIQRHLIFLDQELGKSADPRVVALVKTPEGMRAIFDAQQAHYDPRTRLTLSPEQAARYVLEEAQKKLAPWQRVLGGGAPPAAAAPAAAPAATPAPAPRVKTLTRSASASGGGNRPLSDNELFEKYERLARLPG